jgi:8-oxo-dGTP pyrophosphatase MutT (NUDIX family)
MITDMDTNNPFTVTGTKVVYQNPWITVHEDAIIRPEGTEGIYGYLESKDSVVVVVLNEQDQVYLIRNYSYPTKEWSWELPGGSGDGEETIVASKRELAEETGILAEDWTQLGRVRVCNGLMTEHMTVHLARNLTYNDRAPADDNEIIRDERFFSLDEINDMIQTGEVCDAQTITGLYLLEQWKKGSA